MKRPPFQREKRSTLHVYRSVLRYIHENSLEIGDKLPSHAELTRQLSACSGTLDVAMQWLVEDQVVSRKQRSGTTIVSLYPPHPKRIIWRVGIVVPPLTCSYFFPVLVQYLHKHLGPHGISDRTYMLATTAMPGSEVRERHPEDFSGLKEDIDLRLLDAVLSATRLVTSAIPVCGAPAWDHSTLGVRLDYRQFAIDAISILQERGCRRITAVSGNHPDEGYGMLLRGSRQMAADRGIHDTQIHSFVCPDGNRHAYQLCARLLAMEPSKRPDGLIFQNDLTAHAFTVALVQQPDYRPVIVSQNNLQVPISFAVPVIKFNLDVEAIAATAVEILIEKLLRPSRPDRLIEMKSVLSPREDEQIFYPSPSQHL